MEPTDNDDIAEFDAHITKLQAAYADCSCGGCNRSGVRLYRDYGSFRRPETDRCAACLDTTDWRVPLVVDTEGNAWGYTSAPMDSMTVWASLPENGEVPVCAECLLRPVSEAKDCEGAEVPSA